MVIKENRNRGHFWRARFGRSLYNTLIVKRKLPEREREREREIASARDAFIAA